MPTDHPALDALFATNIRRGHFYLLFSFPPPSRPTLWDPCVILPWISRNFFFSCKLWARINTPKAAQQLHRESSDKSRATKNWLHFNHPRYVSTDRHTHTNTVRTDFTFEISNYHMHEQNSLTQYPYSLHRVSLFLSLSLCLPPALSPIRLYSQGVQ